ncbi:universal stress protein [Rhodoferax sp.]|uniref:universal stress protein n=1 Tax=Rhodoferax sp. TaxID=50421 RepID=UPI00343BD3F7
MTAGIAAACLAISGDTPQDAMVRIAAAEGCDLIIMGTHARSKVGKFILGSVAASLLAECEIPVLLYRGINGLLVGRRPAAAKAVSQPCSQRMIRADPSQTICPPERW